MDRAEEVWRDALVAWDNGWRDDQAAISVIRPYSRTQQEFYDYAGETWDAAIRAMQAANQHHGGNDG